MVAPAAGPDSRCSPFFLSSWPDPEPNSVFRRRPQEPASRAHRLVTLADELMREPQLALETHARDELGINPYELGSARAAALSSFVACPPPRQQMKVFPNADFIESLAPLFGYAKVVNLASGRIRRSASRFRTTDAMNVVEDACQASR